MPDTLLAIFVDRFVRRLHVTLHAKAPVFDPERIGPGGGMILLTLSEIGAVSMSELANRLVRDKSQLTRAVQSLERKGFLTRSTLKDDQRVSVVALTPKGVTMVTTLEGVLAQTIDEVLAPLTQDDKQQLRDLLGRVV